MSKRRPPMGWAMRRCLRTLGDGFDTEPSCPPLPRLTRLGGSSCNARSSSTALVALLACPGFSLKSVYEALRRLERRGYVISTELPNGVGHRHRLWAITPAGLQRLDEGVGHRHRLWAITPAGLQRLDEDNAPKEID
jgi:hypothetical protein